MCQCVVFREVKRERRRTRVRARRHVSLPIRLFNAGTFLSQACVPFYCRDEKLTRLNLQFLRSCIDFSISGWTTTPSHSVLCVHGALNPLHLTKVFEIFFSDLILLFASFRRLFLDFWNRLSRLLACCRVSPLAQWWPILFHSTFFIADPVGLFINDRITLSIKFFGEADPLPQIHSPTHWTESKQGRTRATVAFSMKQIGALLLPLSETLVHHREPSIK